MKKEELRHIATLARLEMEDEELELFSEQLSQIIQYFGELKKLDTEGVEPLVTPTEIEYWMREDVVHDSLSTEDVLRNAPDKRGHLFKVPPVV